MKRLTFTAPEAPVPLGPYSSAVSFGNLVFTSAQAGVYPGTRVVPEEFEDECRQAFANVRAALASGGSALADVLKVTVLYTDPAHLDTINMMFKEYWPDLPPARTAAIVQLAGDRRIAVDAIGAVGDVSAVGEVAQTP
jgi:2-iminobutanoate/2-iminopropanoate deaminase